MQRRARIGHVKLKPGYICLHTHFGRAFIYSSRDGRIHEFETQPHRIISWEPQNVLPVSGDGQVFSG